jgi:hypothetical protein
MVLGEQFVNELPRDFSQGRCARDVALGSREKRRQIFSFEQLIGPSTCHAQGKERLRLVAPDGVFPVERSFRRLAPSRRPADDSWYFRSHRLPIDMYVPDNALVTRQTQATLRFSGRMRQRSSRRRGFEHAFERGPRQAPASQQPIEFLEAPFVHQ